MLAGGSFIMMIMLFDWVMPDFLLLETYHPYPIYSPVRLTCLILLDQRKRIMILLKETPGQTPNVLISLANEAINKYKEINEQRKAQLAQLSQIASQQAVMNQNLLIKPSNFRTVPCRNYHGPNGCTRGEYCHFIHAYGYEGKEIAREVF